MGGNLSTGGYNPQQPMQLPATNAGGGSLSNFDLNNPLAFLQSVNSKLSAALKPMNVNRNEFSSNVNLASLDKLNIRLVDSPPPAYNNNQMQAYNTPYPNQGYGQGVQQQLIPVFMQTANGPQIAGYVTVQQVQQSMQQQPMQQQYQPSTGYAEQPQYTNPTQYQEVPPPVAKPYETNNNDWLAESKTTEPATVVTTDADQADLTALKQQLKTLKTTKTDLKKRIDNDKLSPTEKEALTSQLNDVKQEIRKLKVELRKKGHKPEHKHKHTDGIKNPIVESSIPTKKEEPKKEVKTEPEKKAEPHHHHHH